MDDRRVGLVFRALRRRRGWRQSDLAATANVSESVIGSAEAGHIDTLTLISARRIAAALDIRVDLNARWRGGELDRLLDSRHAEIMSVVAAELVDDEWWTMQEVTYSYFRDRGSIDLLGLKEAEKLAAILEIKSVVASWEETQRRFDEKCRLLSRITYDRVGWRPRTIGKILVFDDSMANWRRIERLGPLIAQAYPSRTREVRRWLREPSGPLAGIWFLSIPRAPGPSEPRGGPHRVRRLVGRASDQGDHHR